jgi:hypothetical protein
MLLRATRLGDLRRSTLSWCRRNRISACNAARDRNSPITADQINLQRSLIGRRRVAGDDPTRLPMSGTAWRERGFRCHGLRLPSARSRRFPDNAFVNEHPFNAERERTRGSLRRRSVVQHTTLAIKLHRCFRRYDIASLAAFTGRALMIFRAGLALNIVGSFVNGLMPLRSFVAGFLMTTNLANPGTKKAPVF